MRDVLSETLLLAADKSNNLSTKVEKAIRELEENVNGKDVNLSESSQQSALRADDYTDYEDYTAILAQLPRFEPYSYPHETTDELNYDRGSFLALDRNVIDFGNPSWKSDKSFQARTSDGRNSLHILPIDISNLSKDTLVADPKKTKQQDGYELPTQIGLILLPALRDIEYSRDRLLRAQLRVEATGNHIAELRRELTKHIGSLDRVTHDRSYSDADARATCTKKLFLLQEILKRQASEEADLLFRQRHTTLMQREFKVSVNYLYEYLSGGAKLGDSEDDFDDEEALENVALHMIAIGRSHPDHSRSDIGNTAMVDVELTETETTDIHHASKIVRNPVDNVRSIADHHSEPLHRVLSGRRPRLLPNNGIHSMDRNKSTSSPHASQTEDLLYIGVQFDSTDHDPELVARSTALSTLLSASVNVQDVRRKDLKPELSINVFFERQADFLARSDASIPLRRTIEQKFIDIKAPSYHTRDSIAMWGSSMSQNTLVDLSRTALYDKVDSGEKRSHIRDFVNVEDWGNSTLNIFTVVFTDFLRVLDLPTLRESLPKVKRPSSLFVHYPGRGSVMSGGNDSIRIQPQGHRHVSDPANQYQSRSDVVDSKQSQVRTSTTRKVVAFDFPQQEPLPHLSTLSRETDDSRQHLMRRNSHS